MTERRRRFAFVVFALWLAPLVLAQQFTTFPEQKELRSPDGNFVIRSMDQTPAHGDFSGLVRCLILEERSTGVSRKLYDYVGKVAVAWSDSNFIIVTDYVNKRTSRILVFAPARFTDPLILNKSQLAGLLPEAKRVPLLENDHVFVEISRVEGSSLKLRVWGYGRRDRNGFGLRCQYDLNEGTAVCQ
jgi:hypothetical protein